MEISGQQHIAAPREAVWRALNDPDVLRRCIPGCQSLERDGPDRLKTSVEIKIGPIGARFEGAVALTDLDPPSGYTIVGEGNGGMAGSAKGAAKVSLTPDGQATILNYAVDAQIGGRLAQLGGPIIEATARQLSAKFFSKFNEQVTGAASPEADKAQAAAPPSVASVPGWTAATPPSGGLPVAWILALVVTALTGFLVGRGGGTGSDWTGLAVGLLVVIVAAAGFEFGRRTSAITLVLDEATLAQILAGRR
ncbi:CoxG family protein [Caulobacter sp. LARHSG274]